MEGLEGGVVCVYVVLQLMHVVSSCAGQVSGTYIMGHGKYHKASEWRVFRNDLRKLDAGWVKVEGV